MSGGVFQLWVVTDGRAGHVSQLNGFCARLRARLAVEEYRLDLSQSDFRYTGPAALCRQFGSPGMPDWILGAGSRCHLPMLWARWRCDARSIVLMRPSLPLFLFDAAVIPRHDSPPRRDSVFASQGALNAVEPDTGPRESGQGLMLLGGIGRHFDWDDGDVLRQILEIADAQPRVTWRISDSPRTPKGFLHRVEAARRDNIQVIPFSETARGWVGQQLSRVGQAWVSRDSVSMVYESISSATPTGLIRLRPSRRSRVTASMDDVIAGGLATPFEQAELERPLVPSREILWEADRAAEWFIARAGLAVHNAAR